LEGQGVPCVLNILGLIGDIGHKLKGVQINDYRKCKET